MGRSYRRALAVTLATLVTAACDRAPSGLDPVEAATTFPARYIALSTSSPEPARLAPIARLEVVITAQGTTSVDAMEAASRRMRRVIEAIIAAGGERRDMRTGEIEVGAACAAGQRPPCVPSNSAIFQELVATIPDVTHAKAALVGMVDSNVMITLRVEDVTADVEPARHQLRSASVAEAARKAQQLSRALGVTLGPPQFVIDTHDLMPNRRFTYPGGTFDHVSIIDGGQEVHDRFGIPSHPPVTVVYPIR